MTKVAEKMRDQLLELTAEDRACLAEFLLASLDPDEADEVEDRWERELKGRMAEMDSGKVKGVPWAEVRARLRKKYG